MEKEWREEEWETDNTQNKFSKDEIKKEKDVEEDTEIKKEKEIDRKTKEGDMEKPIKTLQRTMMKEKRKQEREVNEWSKEERNESKTIKLIRGEGRRYKNIDKNR